MVNRSFTRLAPWLMLVARPVLFLSFQLLIAVLLFWNGSHSALAASAGWWPLAVLLANFVTIGILIWLHRRESEPYLGYARFKRETWRLDLPLSVLVFIGAAPLSMLPGEWLAGILFGSSETAFSLMFQPLPLWARITSILMPLTIAFAELPTYFGYCMPRLGDQLKSSWRGWAVASFFLAFQHVAAPAVPDVRFFIYRLGMFIPFAYYFGLVLKLRPSLFPYIMIGHAMVDMMVVVTLFTLPGL